MQTNSRKSTYILIGIVIVLIAGGGAYAWNRHVRTAGWKSYTQKEFGLQLKYPEAWYLYDSLSKYSCCLSVENYDELNATSTAQKGDQKIKIQFGYYDKDISDPYEMASTTPVALGSNTFYTGMSEGTRFFLLPRDQKKGIGVAVFSSLVTSTSTPQIVMDIISTLKLVALPPQPSAATSTATTTGY